MPQTKDKTGLRDIINYQPQNYFSNDEVALIQNTFKGNSRLIGVLRKLFIPTITDPDLPIESFKNDLFFADRNWDQMPIEEAKALIVARQDAIKFICGGLIQLQVIANTPVEDPMEEALRRQQDSSK